MSLITSPFGFSSTGDEVLTGIDLTGKRAVVTGGARGVGVEIARALAGAGAEVTLTARDKEAGERTVADIITSTGNARVHAALVDLADLESVRAFTARWTGPLDILINNAGVMALTDHEHTRHGSEMQFGVNHLGHFALTTGLHRALAAAGGARVVTVSSSGHRMSPVVFEDIHFERREYDAHLAYGQSKTACALFAVGMHARWARDGIIANIANPGSIRETLERHIGEGKTDAFGDIPWKTVRQGAATATWMATSPLLAEVGGLYFEDCKQAPVTNEIGFFLTGVNEYALDKGQADLLWGESERLVASA
jgi:NAD(P)-dependent dehydrogenase (short-subunit alcohol dehydrogenase family)